MDNNGFKDGSLNSESQPTKPTDIPGPAVRRLSLYLRQMEACHAGGKTTISSKELGDSLGLTDAQVRKDLAYFGQFGQPGVGYSVANMIERIRHILGTDRTWNILLVGVGNLGTALAAYGGFVGKGFQIVAVVDSDPLKIGQPIPSLAGKKIRSMNDIPNILREEAVHVAILAVPAGHAQEVATQLAAAGIRGILNFAPVRLNVPAEVNVVDVDLSVQLEQLSFRVNIDLASGL